MAEATQRPLQADEAMTLLGKYSRWHLRSYFIIAFGFGIPFSWALMSVIFIADTPPHRCQLPENATVNESIPLEYRNNELVLSQCSMYVNGSHTNITQPCTDGYWYDPKAGYESTLVTDFDLVCKKNWLAEFSMMLNSVGQTVGAILFNYLADIYGRKPVFLGCLWSNVAIATAQAFSPNFIFYAALSFLDGVQQQGMVGAAIVLAIELFPLEQRTFAGVAIEFFWAFGYILLTPLAYYLRNWRHLQIAITIPLGLTVLFYWMVNESVPWLLANGREKEAEAIVRKAAKINKVTLPEVVFVQPEKDRLINGTQDIDRGDREQSCLGKLCNKRKKLSTTNSDYGIIDTLRSPTLRLYTIIQFIIWFVNSFVYYGVSMTVTSLVGDRYLNFFLYALVEIPGYALCWFLLQKFGRIIPLCGFHLLCGVALLGTLIQTFDLGGGKILIIILSVIGKFAITITFAIIIVQTPELFPTNTRNTGLGISQFAARLATYVAPFARVLVRHTYWVVPVIFGISSIIAGLLAFVLPETRWRPLPETIEEVEQWRREPKFYRPKNEDNETTIRLKNVET